MCTCPECFLVNTSDIILIRKSKCGKKGKYVVAKGTPLVHWFIRLCSLFREMLSWLPFIYKGKQTHLLEIKCN